MIIKVTLTSAGSTYTDSSPFDVYALSSVGDSPGTLVGDNVVKSELVLGKEFNVPIGTTYVKVQSALVPACDNSVIIPVSIVPTTTSSTTSTTTTGPTTSSTSSTTTTSTTTEEPVIDYYADKYECSGCTVDSAGVLVALPASHTPVYNNFYVPLTPDGFVYKLLSDGSPGPGLVLSTVNGELCATVCVG